MTEPSPPSDTPSPPPATPPPPSPPASPSSESSSSRSRMAALGLAALGIVFGDIGTSPLYALRECFHGPHAIALSPGNVLGVLSLILWSLIIVISIKYLVFILRADNRGEGGILALTALITPSGSPGRGRWLLIMMGLFGAALLYGDGMITPAISVLSAVEGLQVATPVFDPYIIPITIVILVVLFLMQRRGTAGIGAVFGPIMLLWFAALALLGGWHIFDQPAVFGAINPLHAWWFFAANGWWGFLVLGSVFLVVTGGEALYADLGHFGAGPIRATWFGVVLPALLLNYFGQGALLMTDPDAVVNPFYRLAPAWALYPLVALATVAAVIASQAIISGAFSLSMQAIQLGYSPRMTIDHTSAEEKGQIYMPAINWALMLACIGLVLGFGSSSALAAAYGVAVSTDMVFTTILFCAVARLRWRWSIALVAALGLSFLLVDLAFFGANIIKIPQGGWFPLLIAAMVFTLLSTWKRGREILGQRMRRLAVPFESFQKRIGGEKIHRVPGTAVFMAGNPTGTPSALLHNLKHNQVLHERNIILTVTTEDVPHVSPDRRVQVESLGDGFYRMTVHYGFMEDPNVPRAIRYAGSPDLEVDPMQATYFLGRENLIAASKHDMALWRERIFAWMSRNARGATAFYHLPPNRVIELGVQVEL